MAAGIQALGMIEFNSIAVGIEAADFMVKAARVEPLFFRTICPGKFLAAVYADVASVQAAVKAGLERGPDAVVDHFVIPNIDHAVISAMSGAGELTPGPALGIIETYSAAASIVAADRAVKAAEVDVAEVRLAMGLGGKAFCLLSGEVAAVEMAVRAGASAAADSGLLVRQTIIPRVSEQVWRHIL